MTRASFRLLLIALLAAPLAACGIKGDLDRPPPVWGAGTTADVPEETEAAESLEDDADDPFAEDEDEIGYGIDVAD